MHSNRDASASEECKLMLEDQRRLNVLASLRCACCATSVQHEGATNGLTLRTRVRAQGAGK